MMNRMSFSETIFLFFLALIIFGPKKLPEIARTVGKYLNEFRRASNEFKAQIEQEIAHLDVEQKKQTILPPSPRVEGTTSRTLHSATAEASPTEKPVAEKQATENLTTEAPATLAAAEPTNHSGNGAQPPVATEADVPSNTPSDSVTSSTSQESHA
jgi:sec-independent protein translocase protein TatB